MDDDDDLYDDIDESPELPNTSSPSNTQGTDGSALPMATSVTAAAAPTTTAAATARKQVKETTAQHTNNNHHPRSLVEEVKHLQEKVGKLAKENETLKRNMGTLFRTATAEVQRKDKEILRLTTELDRIMAQKSSSG